MAQKDSFISCPKCQQQISAYALLCPYCCTKISRSDFGKVQKSPEECSPDPSSRIGWGNVAMLIILFANTLAIYAGFQHKMHRSLGGDPVEVLFSRENFDQVCQEGLLWAMQQEGVDIERINNMLDAYAKFLGYPDRASLLKICSDVTGLRSQSEAERSF